jgi:O-antigen ligase
VALLGAFTVLTGLSLIWAIQPSVAWVETNRTITALLVFSAGIALVRLLPSRWRALLGGVLVASLLVSGYALLTKIFPAWLAEQETYGRLREPFEYWNAVGLLAALGLPPAIWLGARRDGHAGLAALAYPAAGVLVLTMLLAYSRGSLLAAGLGLAAWFALAPLRLRSATVLVPSVALGALTAWWAFGQDGLSDDRMPLAIRSNAGTELGVLLGVLVLVLLAIGFLASWIRDRRPRSQSTRRAWGIALLVGLALVPLAAAGALATTERGLGGSVSKGWNDLTDPEASTPANDPGRLTAIGSVRARYWRDAIEIFQARTAVGVGAGGYAAARLRFREDDLDVLHAHGHLVQTAADLGLVGLAVTLALLAAWLAAAIRATGPWTRPGWRVDEPERLGLLALACVVLVFGVHSLVDWTWFVPGTVVPALVCAGWVAGRGPWSEPLLRAARSPLRIAAAVSVLVLAGLATWATTQPQRAVDRTDEALAALAAGRVPEARELATEATDIDPLAVDPLFALSEVESAASLPVAAKAALERAVKLQPATPETWIRLARFELLAGNAAAAQATVRPALYLDPRSAPAQAIFIEASRKLDEAAAQAKAKAKAKRPKKKSGS